MAGLELYLNLHDLSIKKVDTRILCLLKIGRQEHMESLARGTVFCHHLAHYKNPEFANQPFYDPHEGLMHVLPAESAYVEIKNEATGEKTRLDLAPGSQLIVAANLHSPAFCLHAIHTDEWTHKEFSEAELPQFREFLQVPAEMDKFNNGSEEPYVWVPNDPNAFFKRVEDACKRDGIGLTADLVRYVDLTAYKGQVPQDRIGFIKQHRHREEREYRMKFRGPNLSNPFTIDVGDLRDISQVMSLSQFKKNWRVDFK